MNTKFANKTDREIDAAVRIQGTNYDRKRKVTKSMKRRMEQMHNSGKSYNYIANYFGVAYTTVRYNLDKEYKEAWNKRRDDYARNWKPTSETLTERAAYKRDLLNNKNARRAVSVNF